MARPYPGNPPTPPGDAPIHSGHGQSALHQPNVSLPPTSATRGKRFTDLFTLEGDALKRPPKGFDAEHHLIGDLKRKEFIATARLTQKAVTGVDFPRTFADHCRRAAPFMRFLCQALDVPF